VSLGRQRIARSCIAFVHSTAQSPTSRDTLYKTVLDYSEACRWDDVVKLDMCLRAGLTAERLLNVLAFGPFFENTSQRGETRARNVNMLLVRVLTAL